MQLKNKQIYIRYFVGILGLELLAVGIKRNWAEFGVINLTMLAVVINHWLLVDMVRGAVSSVVKNEKYSMFVNQIIKIILIGSVLSFGVQIMGKRIIIPVLFYILQIGILYKAIQ